MKKNLVENINYLQIFVKMWNSNLLIALTLFLLMVPIFIGYDGDSVVFHSSYLSSWKAIPLGLVPLLPLLFVSSIKNLLTNYRVLIFICLSTLISYVLSSDVRTLIVGTQLVLLISSVEAFDWLFSRGRLDWNKIQEYLFFIIVLIVFIKFYTDVHYYYGYYMFQKFNVSIFLGGEYWSYLSGLYQNPFSNPAFINKRILIYDFYDYFQIIYILGAFLAYKMFSKYPMLSVLLIMVVLLYMFYSTSRLWKLTLLCLPFLYIGTKIRFKFTSVFVIFVCGWIFVVALVGIYHNDFVTGRSLSLRMNLIHEFFWTMEWNNIIFPRTNLHISATNKSMHNEFLEVWYRCGVIAALSFWWWGYEKFKDVAESDKMLSILLAFILIPGGLIQLNYLHLYSMLMLAIFISASRTNQKTL